MRRLGSRRPARITHAPRCPGSRRPARITHALRASHTHTSCAALAHAALPLSVFGWRWWRSKTKLFFKLTRSPDGENDDKLRRFLRLMNLRESDLPLLRFWTGGLSRPYRTQLLQRA